VVVMGGDAAEAAEGVIVQHQRAGIEGCICGWGQAPGELGTSWAAHVVHELQLAGLDFAWR
jgi:hypothetical protein